MNPQSLIMLVNIVDAGNLSRAAKLLKMSRANISYHLQQLEQSVGQQLLRRTSRRLELTEIGQRLYEHGCSIRNELLAASESVASLGKSLQGAVRISLPTGFGAMVMADWLIEFKRAYPNISVNVLFENRVDDLLQKEVDMAVRVMSEPPEHLVASYLSGVRYVICAERVYAAKHLLPQTPGQLAGLPLITSAVIGRQLKLSAFLGERHEELVLNPGLASENFQFLRSAILAGLGFGLVPDYVVAADVARGDVVLALQQWRFSVFGSRMYLLRMPGRYQTLAARTLSNFILQQFKGPQA